MTEFIINSDQLEQLIEGIEHETSREINRVICNDKELPSIVRCCDCKYYKRGDDGWWCLRSISTRSNHPDGFCAWGVRA